MPVATIQSIEDQALEIFRKKGNPFHNYFARNPDDEVCARYHVAELFATERDQLFGVIDLYRADTDVHSEVVPVLGNKGAGKTHLLHSIKHGSDDAWQLLVTPGTYHRDCDFLEYLLFQIIDTLLGGAKQRGNRPLEVVSEEVTRRLMYDALEALSSAERLDLFPAPGLGRWARRLGVGSSQAHERVHWMRNQLAGMEMLAGAYGRTVRQLCEEAGISPERALDIVAAHLDKTATHSTAGVMRQNVYDGLARAALLGDESELASFLTYGFAELEFNVRPTRQDLVLAAFKVLMGIFRELRIPVVVAFDQLEDLLLARRTDDGHRVAEAFFAGIVQAIHQIDGICFLAFAERGLWNRFVPSLDGYIQDRLNNPVHVPGYGSIKTLRLEAPSPELARAIVAARLHPSLEELADTSELSPIFPFLEEQVFRIARTEPTLRDMLQQFRHLFDHAVYGVPDNGSGQPVCQPTIETGALPAIVKSVVVVQSADNSKLPDTAPQFARPVLNDLWDQEWEMACRQLAPEGAVTGATRELQAGLGKFLQVCHEHGVKVGPWRMQHAVAELTFGNHPTYGVISIGHWVCRDGEPWKVGVGLFLGRGPGKPKDLETKLAVMEADPRVIDHLILLRPDDDLIISGKSKSLWQDAERRGRHTRLEAMSLHEFAVLYAFPRWLTALTEAMPDGQPLPNLADFLQEKCESMLERVCMPVQQ